MCSSAVTSTIHFSGRTRGGTGRRIRTGYFPVFDNRAELPIRVAPEAAEDAAVYVDGFYAGVVDDFNGVFQGLPLTPGGHSVTLFLEGYRTVRRNIYLSPGSTFNLRETMQPLPAGEVADPPEVAPPVPTPPAGTYQTPVTPPRSPLPSPTLATSTTGVGTLDLRVEPADIEVRIDGRAVADLRRRALRGAVVSRQASSRAA